MNLNAEQVQHVQVIGLNISKGLGVRSLRYPDMLTQIGETGLQALAARIEDLGYVAIGEPHLRLDLEASVIHPNHLTQTQLTLVAATRLGTRRLP